MLFYVEILVVNSNQIYTTATKQSTLKKQESFLERSLQSVDESDSEIDGERRNTTHGCQILTLRNQDSIKSAKNQRLITNSSNDQ